MNIIASFFILIAIVLSLLTITALIGWWRGVDNVLFPGLGLVAAMPAIIVLLLILNIGFVIAAAAVKPRTEFADKTKLEQKFEYPNDIFGGCNGLPNLSIAKDPKNWGEDSGDHHLEICITPNDVKSIYDVIAPGRVEYEDYIVGEDHQKQKEKNRKILDKAALKYPMLSRIKDIYKDYDFSQCEVKDLREECLQLKTLNPNSAADLVLRKIIYACDEALKENSYLMFPGY